jgi:hypothetical protein
MAFCGRTDIRQVDKSILLPGTYPTAAMFGETSRHSGA